MSTSAKAAGEKQGQGEKEEEKRFDDDPSTPGRRVAHKKANQPFLKHQRWKEQQKQQEMAKAAAAAAKRKAGNVAPQERGFAFLLLKWSLVAVLLAIGGGQFIAGDLLWGYRGKYVQWLTPPRSTPTAPAAADPSASVASPIAYRKFTPEELWTYNGKGEEGKKRPVYLSILGHVYDVTPGRWIYGPGGAYHFFAGRDASRAYVTGCFETHLTHDLRGLSLDEIKAIQEWKAFFDMHRNYRLIGSLDLEPVDPNSPIPEPCGQDVETKQADEVASSASPAASSA